MSSPSRIADLKHELDQRLTGEVHIDPVTKVLYSTDASNYQIEPLGVIFPSHSDEICLIVELCREHGVPVLARGSGTSLAGQAVGEAIILDCSRHLNRIHAIDEEAQFAIVDSGVVLNDLNKQAASKNLMVGPDPASADRATLGGMIGNNATGAHSIRYGMMADHLLEAHVVLSDGSNAILSPHSSKAHEGKGKGSSLLSEVYRNLLDIRQRSGEAIRRDWPQTWRRASGYSLNYLVDYTPGRPDAWYDSDTDYPPTAGWNVAPLLCGSEGTLAVLRKAKVRLVPRPQATALVVLAFESIAEAAEATPRILETKPSAVELLPRALIERARGIPVYARKLGFVEGDPAALLVVEYAGETPAQVKAAARQLGRGLLIEGVQDQADLWVVRKAGLGLLMAVPGDLKPITFIEDVAVPVERLGEYVRRVDRILEEHGTFGEWYAHASAGCLHLRPMINLKKLDGVRQMRGIADAIVELVIELRGTISGEHGDGLSHTGYNSRLFGPEIMEVFRRVKKTFDPEGIFNPGKVVPDRDISESDFLEQNLRLGPDYRAVSPKTVFSFNREGGFDLAVESCSGVGVCRKNEGVMCPSFQATRDEMHSTRGRANMLRAALSGVLPPDALTSIEMYKVLDLCLECKGCKAECPTGVDVARMKAEFLALYRAEHGVPLRDQVFANISGLSSLAGTLAPAFNFFAGSPLIRWGLEKTLRISRDRSLPRLSNKPFRYEELISNHPDPKSSVVLFLDTYTKNISPGIGEAAVKVLGASGYNATVLPGQVCCGRPMISKGLLEKARRMALKNIDIFAPVVEAGIPILGLEPSCLETLRDEYVEFFPDDPRATSIAKHAYLIEEFLVTPNGEGERPLDRIKFISQEERVHVHGHCHAKASVGMDPTLEMLRGAGYSVEEIPSGCCGMAGSFGYEQEHFELSMKIAEQRLLPAVRQAVREGSRISTAGFSCRTQIRDGADVPALHPIQLLSERITT